MLAGWPIGRKSEALGKRDLGDLPGIRLATMCFGHNVGPVLTPPDLSERSAQGRGGFVRA